MQSVERPKTEEEKEAEKKKFEEQQKELSDIVIKDGDYQVLYVCDLSSLFFRFRF